jgi:sulfite oxidase
LFYRGTAVYRGVPLKKVLKLACGGVKPECEHLEFLGVDTYIKLVLFTNTQMEPYSFLQLLSIFFRKNNVHNYAVSVPWRKVRQNEEVILAWEMNGKPLPKSHGAPLRLVVTGYIGARSCKWVYKINALAEYLYFTSQVGLIGLASGI